MARNPICAHWGRQGGRTFRLASRSCTLPPHSPSRRGLACRCPPSSQALNDGPPRVIVHAVIRPPATNNGAGYTRRARCVSPWLGGDEMVHAHARRPSGPGGGSPSVMLCNCPQRLHKEIVVTRARSTQIRQIDVWVTMGGPHGPRRVRSMVEHGRVPRRDVALALDPYLYVSTPD